MAPEQLQEGSSYNGKVDIWSLGHLLFQLLTGQQLIDDENLDDQETLKFLIKNAPLNNFQKDNTDLTA